VGTAGEHTDVFGVGGTGAALAGRLAASDAQRAGSTAPERAERDDGVGALGIYAAIRDESGAIVGFRVEHLNDPAALCTRTSVGERVGHGSFQLAAGHHIRGLFDDCCTVVETGISLAKEVVAYAHRRVGERDVRFLEVEVAKLRDGFVATWRDVAGERTPRESASARSARRWSSSTPPVEASHDAVIARGPDGRITYWSQGAERIYGWTRDEAVGRAERALLETRSEVPLAEIEAIVAAGEMWTGELVRRTRHGQRVVVSARWALQQDGNGRVVGVVEVDRDVTARRAAEEAMAQQIDELERSRAEIAEFALGVAHDLSAPLFTISGLAWSLAGRPAGQLDPEARDMLQRISSSADLLQRLVADFPVYAGVAGHADVEGPVDCTELLRELVDGLSRSIEEAHAEVTWANLPVVAGTASELSRVFENLLANALKFRSPDRPPRVRVSARAYPGGWLLMVADNGIGIEPRHRDRIFGMFERASYDDKFPGWGMGLAICHKIIERHRGRIWVEDTLGGGSTFCFTVPNSPDARV
jgi:PAS domain S-box-containing protein